MNLYRIYTESRPEWDEATINLVAQRIQGFTIYHAIGKLS